MEQNTISGNEVADLEETTEETEIPENPVDTPQDILGDNESTTDDTQDFSNIVDDAESVSDSDALEEIAVTFDGESYPEVSGNDVYIIETTTEELPFWQKPLEEYNTTEGLLLCIFAVFCISTLWTNIIGR